MKGSESVDRNSDFENHGAQNETKLAVSWSPGRDEARIGGHRRSRWAW